MCFKLHLILIEQGNVWVINVIIRGPLGVGKSTIAKRLSRKIKAEYVPFDFSLEKLGLDKADEKEACVPVAISSKRTSTSFRIWKKKLKGGKNVVL